MKLWPEHYVILFTLIALYLVVRLKYKEHLEGTRAGRLLRRNISLGYSAHNPYYYEDIDVPMYDYPFWEMHHQKHKQGRKVNINPYTCIKSTNPWMPPEYPWYTSLPEQKKSDDIKNI